MSTHNWIYITSVYVSQHIQLLRTKKCFLYTLFAVLKDEMTTIVALTDKLIIDSTEVSHDLEVTTNNYSVLIPESTHDLV